MNLAINRGIGSNSGPSCLGRGRNVVIQSRVFQRSYSLTNRRKKLGSLSGNGNLLLSSSLERNTLYLSPNRKLSNPPFKIKCNLDDSLSYTDGNARTIKFEEESESIDEPSKEGNNSNSLELDGLKDLLQKALKELEVAQLNSTMFEEKAQSISETAIALKDKAEKALKDVSFAVSTIQEIMNDEDTAKEAVRKATMSLSLAEARLKVATEALLDPSSSALAGEDESYKKELDECKAALGICEMQLKKVQDKRIELQNEVDRLNEIAENAQMEASRAEEDVSNIMLLAEEAVKLELDAAQRVSDAELAVLKAEKAISLVETAETISSEVQLIIPEEPITGEESPKAIKEDLHSEKDEISNSESSNEIDKITQEETEKISPTPEPEKEIEPEVDKSSKTVTQGKKQESTGGAQKALLKKSSRFLSASFFSSDGKELTWSSLFRGLVSSLKQHAPKLVFVLLLGIGGFFVISRAERNGYLISQPDIVMEEVTTNTKPLVRAIKKFPKRVKQLIDKMPRQELKEGEKSLLDILCLLLASVIFVPAFQKIPGGSPVLGYLAAGVLIGPYGFSIIRHVHGTKEIAEFGVVFLLFNIGLELSVERLSSMKKYVFGLGTAQVFATSIAIGFISHYLCGQPGPAAVVIGTGLALSSTAIVLQLLQERGENTSRHGRATFSVLLFQDLAVVVLLILIPLISPNSSKGGIGFQAIAEALGKSAVKAMLAITLIIAGGRLLLRPIYKQIAENQNAEIFSANTLLVVLGTSLITARAGLSMALGAFLAGLLLAETEFSLQVESDIAPFRGLFLGLFFMTVGMSIDLKVLFSNCPVILSTICALILGKTIIVTLLGKLFGISTMASIRAGLMLAPGGEFAFVAFGDAVKQGLLSSHLSSLLFLVVGLSMALTPWLAAGGQLLSSKFEQHDVRSLIPAESETDDLQDHIIICGFGRVGQIIAQLLSERLIPFVALDVSPDRVALGRAVDLPVYFGDAGSREILHKVGAERACAAAIALDTPGANYRAVWALSKYYPNVKTFVRAHDVVHGLNLEKAGASAVVPETLEPSLQLAAAVLAQAKLPTSEIASAINEFRSRHLSELSELCESSGSSLGYGFSRVMLKDAKPLKIPVLDSDENDLVDGALA